MSTARPILMWAPIYQGARSEWIIHNCIRATRREARKAYASQWKPEHADEMLKTVRFARVVVRLHGEML